MSVLLSLFVPVVYLLGAALGFGRAFGVRRWLSPVLLAAVVAVGLDLLVSEGYASPYSFAALVAAAHAAEDNRIGDTLDGVLVMGDTDDLSGFRAALAKEAGQTGRAQLPLGLTPRRRFKQGE